MLRLPNNRFEPFDLKRLADWAEACCLCRAPAELSVGDLADELHGSLLYEPADGDESHWDRVARIAEEVLAEARVRQALLKHAYPFNVTTVGLTANAEWPEYLCYTTLLAADIGRFYKGTKALTDTDEHFTRLFEKIVQACLQARFGGKAVRFGWPIEPDWPTGIVDRVKYLAQEFGLDATEPEKNTEPHDKDIGLDVVTRIALGDQGSGTGIILVQCATGENWDAKSDEPYTKQWQNLLRWNSHLIQAVAFPWRQENVTKFRQLIRRFPGLVFDRLRLTCGGDPDHYLDAAAYMEVQEWCEGRLAELPM